MTDAVHRGRAIILVSFVLRLSKETVGNSCPGGTEGYHVYSLNQV